MNALKEPLLGVNRECHVYGRSPRLLRREGMHGGMYFAASWHGDGLEAPYPHCSGSAAVCCIIAHGTFESDLCYTRTATRSASV